MSTQYRNVPRGQPARSNGKALPWIAAALAATTVVAGLGWAGVFGGDDASTVATTVPVSAESTTTAPLSEWPAAAAGDIDLHSCPAGEVVGRLSAGDSVVVVGRAQGNAWVAIQNPDDPTVTAWLLASALAGDNASPVWGALPAVGCTLSGGDSIQSFSGKVVDGTTGVPIAGVSLSPTDNTGAPQTAYTVVSAADGSYEISGLINSEYGVWADGTAAGYEQGFIGGIVGPLGYLVEPTWVDGATAAPGVIGDIALDSTGAAPASTTTVPTAPTGSTLPGTTLPGTTLPGTTLPPGGPNTPPTIGAFAATPDVVYSKPVANECSTITSVVTIDVSDASGVASVKVKWSYRSRFGTRTLYRVGTSDTWKVTLGTFDDPTTPASISLEFTATDTEGLVATLAFPNAITLKRCS